MIRAFYTPPKKRSLQHNDAENSMEDDMLDPSDMDKDMP